jgi:hypothetical protein
MHFHRAQFTIRSLLIAVVIVAGLLALPSRLREVAGVQFLAARFTLERVADQIAAGQTFSFPQSAGMFQLVSSRARNVVTTC